MPNKRKDIPEQKIRDAIADSRSMLQAANSINVPYSTFIRKAKELNVYIPNQFQIGVRKGGKEAIPLMEILDGKHPTYSTSHLKHRLFDEKVLDEVCVKCGLGNIWIGKPISLHLDHKNGINNDHRSENLHVLCPNCHSQTSTYCGKNKRKIDNITDEEIIETFDVVGTLAGTCRKLGLSRSQTNRISKLILK